MEQSNNRARRRPVQAPARQTRQARERQQRVRIEENGYRAPAKWVQAIKSVNWLRVGLCVFAVYIAITVGLKLLTIVSQKKVQAELLEPAGRTGTAGGRAGNSSRNMWEQMSISSRLPGKSLAG